MGRIKLIHYHTNTKDAVPAAENLALGEIAVNYNANNPFLAIKDSNGRIRRINQKQYYVHYDNMPPYQLVFEKQLPIWSMCGYVFTFASFDAGCGFIMLSAHTQNNNGKTVTLSTEIISRNSFSAGYSPFHVYLNQTTRTIRVILECRNNSNTRIKELVNYDAQSNIEFQPQNWFAEIPEDYGEQVPIIINSAPKVQGHFVFNGNYYNGSNTVEISQIDCGEF